MIRSLVAQPQSGTSKRELTRQQMEADLIQAAPAVDIPSCSCVVPHLGKCLAAVLFLSLSLHKSESVTLPSL